jgi:hypothetical protein
MSAYNLFISHAWRYHDDYDRLVKLLDVAPYFNWRNYSVPRHDPAIDPNTSLGDRLLRKELDNQIRPVNCVLIISGMYAAYSYWIQTEIDIARGYFKPIIGLVPFGQERVPMEIQQAAREMVGWRTDSVIDAIRKWSI